MKLEEEQYTTEVRSTNWKERAREGWLLLVFALAVGTYVAWRFTGLGVSTPAVEPGHITAERGRGSWSVGAAPLADIAGLSFTPDGSQGVFVDSAGRLFISDAGGASWYEAPRRVPLGDGEVVGAVMMPEVGQIGIATGMDESRYTALYQGQGTGEWTKIEGEWGGIAGGSRDGSVLVGGGGLVAVQQSLGGSWEWRQLVAAEQITLYGAERAGSHIVVVGDYGFIGESRDDGRTWFAGRVGETALYAVALAGERMYAGGNASLWVGHETDAAAGISWSRVADVAATGVTIHALWAGEGEVVAGGETDDGAALVLSSIDGKGWEMEMVNTPQVGGITALGRGRAGLFAATRSGRLLQRS